MRIIKTYFILSLLLFTNLLSAQNDINPKADTIEISKPSILSTHPLGLLFTRLEGHFKTQPSKKTIIDFNISSGNVWAPPVKAYAPTPLDTLYDTAGAVRDGGVIVVGTLTASLWTLVVVPPLISGCVSSIVEYAAHDTKFWSPEPSIHLSLKSCVCVIAPYAVFAKLLIV